MANGLPEGFVVDEPQSPVASGLPEGFVVDDAQPQAAPQQKPETPLEQVVTAPEPQAQVEDPGFFEQAAEVFTGASQMTPEMESLSEVGAAPELNEMSVPAFKASLGLLAAGETSELKGVLSKQFGDNVSYTEDKKGNVVVNLPSGSYALNKPGLSGQDVIRAAFDISAFTPAGRAVTIPQAIGRSAATEAAIEGAESQLGGQFDISEVVTAAALGGAFKGVEDVLGAGYRAVKGTPESEVVQAGEKAGIPVMTSDIRQPETFAGKMAQQTAEKIPLAGTGGLRETQQEARQQAVGDIAERYGQFSYDAISDSLKTQKNRVKNAAGSVLSSVGKSLDEAGEIPLNNTNAAISEVSEELSKKGVIRSSQAMDDLNVLIDSISEAPQTFTSLKENRTAFREIVQGADKAERSQLTSRSKSLLQKVESAMRKDMDSFASNNLDPAQYGKWKKANAVYADEAKKLTKTRLKNVLDKGDVAPESVQNLLFSQKPSEVRLLYKSLTPEGRANARSAIISKAVDNLSRRAGGITPNSFASEMKKYGLQTDEFFKGEEKRSLNGLLKVLDSTRRAQEAAVTTPTGQQLIGAGTLGAATVDLGATLGTGLTVGLLARAVEKPTVRNALLRLDSMPKGSTRYEKALREAVEVLTPAAQSVRSELSEGE